MVVTSADVASALVLLAIIEGFKRVTPDEIVFVSWRARWSTTSNPTAVWLRRIGWLWIAPVQTAPRIFVCRTDATDSNSSSSAALEAVKSQLRRLTERYRWLGILT